MKRLAVIAVLCLLGACKNAPETPAEEEGAGGETGEGGRAMGGRTGSGGKAGASGAGSGSGGASEPGAGGAIGMDAAPAGEGGASSGEGGSAIDAPVADAKGPSDGGADVAKDPGGDILPGRPYIHLCKKDWTQTQCCEFLCACLVERCSDAPRALPGIPKCMSTCMGLSNMTMRCHVYHCYEARDPAFKDHESHCAHAANTLNGGGCPTAVYQ